MSATNNLMKTSSLRCEPAPLELVLSKDHPGYFSLGDTGESTELKFNDARGVRLWLTFALALSFLSIMIYIMSCLGNEAATSPEHLSAQDSDIRFRRLAQAISQLAASVKQHEDILKQDPNYLTERFSSNLPPSIPTDNFPIVRVNVPKANLRISPNKKAAATMAVSQGTRLVISGERKEWLNVYAPSGEVLWIQKELVSADRTLSKFSREQP